MAETKDLHQSRPLFGIALRILLNFLVVIGGAAIQLTEVHYPVGELVFARGIFGIVPFLFWTISSGTINSMYRVNRIGAHFTRAVIGVTAMATQFAAIQLLPLSDATAILQASPIFVVILAAILLNERVGIIRWSAVTAGLIGIMLISFNYVGFERNADAEVSLLGLALAIGSSVLIAAAGVTVRSLTGFESAQSIVFYYTIFLLLTSLLTLPFGWVMPTGLDILWLALLGLTYGTGQVLLTISFRAAPASLLAPFDYISIVWAILIGWAIFGHLPGFTVVLGAIVVVAAGLVIIYREHRLRTNRAKG